MSEQKERTLDIAHLGRVELLTPKPDKSVWYFRDVLGMEVVHSAGSSIYLRGYGDYATATLQLTEALAPGVELLCTVVVATLRAGQLKIFGSGSAEDLDIERMSHHHTALAEGTMSWAVGGSPATGSRCSGGKAPSLSSR